MRNKLLILCIALCLILTLAIYIIPPQQTWYTIARTYSLTYDPLYLGGVAHQQSTYDLFLVAYTKVLPLSSLSFIFALANLVVWYGVLRRKPYCFLLLFLVILSPIFLSITLGLSSAPIVLLLLGLFVLANRFAGVWLFAIGLFFEYGIIILALLVFSKKYRTVSNTAALLLGCIIGYFYYASPISALIAIEPPFSELHTLGIPLITYICAIISLIMFWKADYVGEQVGCFLLILCMFIMPSAIVLGGFVCIFYVAKLLDHLSKATFESKILQTLSCVILMAFLLVSSYLYATSLIVVEHKPSLQILSEEPANSLVLSSPKQSIYIASVANKKTFLAPDITPQSRLEFIQTLTQTTSLSNLTKLLFEEKITHLYFSPDFRSQDVKFGFLLTNQRVFQKIYDDGDYQIYRIDYANVSLELAAQ